MVMLSDVWVKRMMTFITTCSVLATAVICFGACAGICEEISQKQDGPRDEWRDHHFDTHQKDMEKMDRIVALLEEIEEKITPQ